MAMSRPSETDELLALALQNGALKYGDFTLSSGAKSGYYFDGRLLSLDPQGGYLIAKAILPILVEAGVEAIGGPTLGADPMVAAVSLLSYIQGTPVTGFIVRGRSKGYGTRQSIEGPLRPKSHVAIVDDVCTTGGALFRAIEEAEALDCKVVLVISLLDRKQGGSEEIRKQGYQFRALFEADDEGRVEPCSRGR